MLQCTYIVPHDVFMYIVYVATRPDPPSPLLILGAICAGVGLGLGPRLYLSGTNGIFAEV